MQISLHIGVHGTDEDRLLKGLLRNADDFRKEGVAIPGPSRYRALLSDALNGLGDGAPAPEAREVLLDTILSEDPEAVSRLCLSHENLLSVPKLALAGGRLYRKSEQRLQGMQKLFPRDRIGVFLGLRDFATFLPAVYHATPHGSFDEFLGGVDPMHLRNDDFEAFIAARTSTFSELVADAMGKPVAGSSPAPEPEAELPLSEQVEPDEIFEAAE